MLLLVQGYRTCNGTVKHKEYTADCITANEFQFFKPFIHEAGVLKGVSGLTQRWQAVTLKEVKLRGMKEKKLVKFKIGSHLKRPLSHPPTNTLGQFIFCNIRAKKTGGVKIQLQFRWLSTVDN